MKHVVLYVGHLYKLFWTKNFVTGLAGFFTAFLLGGARGPHYVTKKWLQKFLVSLVLFGNEE